MLDVMLNITEDIDKDIQEGMPLTIRQVKYLEVYSKTFDHKLACKESNLSPKHFGRVKETNPFFVDRLKRIQQAWLEKYELCPEILSGKLVNTIYKLDKALDNEKYAVSTALVKAIELGMKTTGMLESEQQTTGTHIQFNIDLGLGDIKQNIKTVGKKDSINITLNNTKNDYNEK